MDTDSQQDTGRIKAPTPPVMPTLDIVTVEVTEDGEENVIS